MKVDLFKILLIGSFGFFLAGCSEVTAATPPEPLSQRITEATAMTEPQTTPTLSRQEDDMPKDPPLTIPKAPNFQTLIEEAKVDLAQRLSISASQVNVFEIQEVSWPDDSMGCPESGKTYTPAPTPGYIIILETNGSKFEYHANLRNYIFYCANPTPPRQETP